MNDNYNNMLNIVLIIPPADIYLTPSLGIALLSSMVKRAGHNVDVIDLNILLYNDIEIDKLLWRRDLNHYWDSEDVCNFIWDSKVRKMLENSHDFNDVDIVGIRISQNSKIMANKIAEWFRSTYPKIKLIGGGPDTWFNPGDQKYYNNFDKIIYGHAEKEFANIIGLTDDSELVPDFSWGLNNEYINNNMLPIETSRGCIYKCKFCQERRFGKFEILSMEHVKKNLDLVKRLNVKTVYFVDSFINTTDDRLNELLNLTKRTGLKCYCNIVPFNLTMENIKKLKEVSDGCFAGIETFSDKFATKLRKPGSRNEIIKVLDMMRQVGLKIETGIIIGGPPFQTEKDVMSDVTSIIAYSDVINKVMLSPLRIFKNSELFDQKMDHTDIGWEFNDGDFNTRLSYLKTATEKLYQAGINTEVSPVGIEDWINGLKREDEHFRRQR